MAGNPAFRNSPAFTENPQRAAQAVPGGQQAPYGQAPYGQAPYGQQQYGGTPYGQPQQYGGTPYGQQPGVPSPEQLNQQFNAPSAGPVETERLTYDSVIMKTVLTLGVTAVGFVITLGLFFMGNAPLFFGLMYGGAIVGFVLALVNIFKKEPSPALILAYAAAQGLFLGGISASIEWGWNMPGIIFQALIATACVFGVTLAGYAFRVFRTSPKLNKIFFIAIIGYGLFSLVNFFLMITGVNQDAWGLRSMEVFGIPLGLILGALAVLLGAYSLVMDFEGIEAGVKRGVHKKYGWSAAFGITMTVIWLYIEILRIIAILRGNN